MKKLIGLTAIALFAMISCKNNENHNNDMHQDGQHNDSTMHHHDSHESMMDSETTMYSCPMHPEVKGNKNDKCPECGMDLEVTDSTTSKE